MENILNENIQLTDINKTATIGFAGSGVVPSGMITFFTNLNILLIFITSRKVLTW